MWLGLHFPDLSLHQQVRAQLAPEQPVALLSGYPLTVAQCNAAARRQGVAVGQKVATATALCEGLQLLPSDPDRDREGLEQLAQWAYGFSAQISLEPPQGLVLEARSMLRLFGGIPLWLAQLQQGLHAMGLPWSAALGPTPLAAWLLASQGEEGCCQVESDKALARLFGCSLHQLGRPEAASLAQMGVKSLGQLMALPRAELGRRFGAELLLWLERLLGTRPDPRPDYVPPQAYRRKLILLEEVVHLQGLRFPLKRLFTELGEVLRRRQLALPVLQVRLHHRHRPCTEIALRGAGSEHRAEAWMALCQLKLERQVLFEPVTEIELVGAQLQPLQIRNGALFTTTAPDGKAEDLLAQLAARLGSSRVRGLCALSEHRPEYAVDPVTPGQGGDKRSEQSESYPLHRPHWLFREPQPIVREEYRLLRGPERLESCWWEAQPVARDYFLAQARCGGLCWLFRSAEGWFLHGWF
ncbi:DNA polymerase Y family protein [Ferrimonas gelatinilytica]|uniref:DNA polymerase Y family protein n=1 Tax=Ferrimonas gelatinilytica TaxID=1255257 RepID=A0ABP9RWV3_9GAMM